MDPFKNLINRDTVVHTGRHLRRAWPRFDHKRFEAQAATGLEGLEFKARAMQLADALEATLPADFNAACELIEASLAPPLAIDTQGEPLKLGEAQAGSGVAGWALWAVGEFVARRGVQDAAAARRGLACLHAVTQRFTAEFAIRPLIQRHPGAVAVFGFVSGVGSFLLVDRQAEHAASSMAKCMICRA